MPEQTDRVSDVLDVTDVLDVNDVTARVRSVAPGLSALLDEADAARLERAEASGGPDGDGAVSAWNHFENIPTFYNWNNRPR